MMQQLEFPFTRTGALQQYNHRQVHHMTSLYKEFVRNSDLRHSESLWNTWVETYVDRQAVTYEGKYGIPTSTLVEYQNEKVLAKWKANKLEKMCYEHLQ